jgi:hypothetical protein
MVCFSRRFVLLAAAGIAASAVSDAPGWADDAPPSGMRVALGGYDPVAYFTDGHPVKGTQEFWSVFDNAVYFFRNGEHRAIFSAAPDRYAPQYAGFCAMSMSHGMKMEADPEAWIISDDKLFVFFAKDGIPGFKEEPKIIVGKADANWRALRTSP